MKKKLISIAAGIAALLSVQSASAYFDASALEGWYIGTSGSGSWHGDTELGNDNACVSHDFGYGFNFALGYELCDWNMRVEAEYVWRHWSNDRFKNASSEFTSDSGHLREYAFMGNLLYDMELSDPFGMYIGAGLGLGNSRLELNNSDGAIRDTADDWVFAWQLMAGMVWDLNECWDLTLGYRFLALGKPSLPTSVNGVCADVDNMPYSNNIDLGLRFKF